MYGFYRSLQTVFVIIAVFVADKFCREHIDSKKTQIIIIVITVIVLLLVSEGLRSILGIEKGA